MFVTWVCDSGDANMFMFIHIGKTCSKAFHGLYKIRKIRKFSVLSLRRLVHAFQCDVTFEPLGNSLLFSVPKYQTDHFIMVLHAAARLMFSIQKKFGHILSASFHLHWLPLAYCIHFKRLLQNFAGVLQKKKNRTRANFKETPTNYITKERL